MTVSGDFVRTLSTLFLLPFMLAGCDNSTFCFVSTLNVSPQNATVPPGNSQQFLAFGSTTTVACTITNSNLRSVTWSVSDPVNVTISNTPDATFGNAACTGATAGPVTVTATLPASANGGHPVTGTATLVCD